MPGDYESLDELLDLASDTGAVLRWGPLPGFECSFVAIRLPGRGYEEATEVGLEEAAQLLLGRLRADEASPGALSTIRPSRGDDRSRRGRE